MTIRCEKCKLEVVYTVLQGRSCGCTLTREDLCEEIVRLEAEVERLMKTPPRPERRGAGAMSIRTREAIVFLREHWHNDGAEGESVHLVCREAESLAKALDDAHTIQEAAAQTREDVLAQIRSGKDLLDKAVAARDAAEQDRDAARTDRDAARERAESLNAEAAEMRRILAAVTDHFTKLAGPDVPKEMRFDAALLNVLDQALSGQGGRELLAERDRLVGEVAAIRRERDDVRDRHRVLVQHAERLWKAITMMLDGRPSGIATTYLSLASTWGASIRHEVSTIEALAREACAAYVRRR